MRHWDVLNEDLHGKWFEEATGNDQITESLFQEVHSLDPKVKLFLNDYQIITTGTYCTVNMIAFFPSVIVCFSF